MYYVYFSPSCSFTSHDPTLSFYVWKLMLEIKSFFPCQDFNKGMSVLINQNKSPRSLFLYILKEGHVFQSLKIINSFKKYHAPLKKVFLKTQI